MTSASTKASGIPREIIPGNSIYCIMPWFRRKKRTINQETTDEENAMAINHAPASANVAMPLLKKTSKMLPKRSHSGGAPIGSGE